MSWAADDKAPRAIMAQACAVTRLLQEHGQPLARVLEQHGLTLEQMRTPWAEIESTRLSDLWRTAELLVGPDAGLQASRYLGLAGFHEVGHCVMAAPSMLLGVKAFANFYPLASGNGLLVVDERESTVSVTFHAHPRHPVPHVEVDALFAMLVRDLRRQGLTPPEPVALELQGAGRSGSRAYRETFGIQPILAAAQDRISFSRHDLMKPMQGSQPDHYQRLVQELSRRLRSAEGSLRDRVLSMLLHVLPGGVHELEEIANRMGVSSRTLQRRLAAEGVVFSALLEQARKEIALQHIRQGDQSIKEIAYSLGYADMNNFTRAFKRWFGMPPSRYQRVDQARRP